MTDEDRFVEAIARVESLDDPNVHLGDHGRAAGRFQWHPDAYFSWQPTLAELVALGPNPTWDACFELALRKFFRTAPGVAPAEIAIAFHLHGQHVYRGDDLTYREAFRVAWSHVA